MFTKANRANTSHGLLLIILFSMAAFYLSELEWVKSMRLSPLIVGIILGTIYANSLRKKLPEDWVPGIRFCTKQILRTGIVLYGFRLTLSDVYAVGLPAVIVDAIIVVVTLSLGIFLGKILKMDSQTALMTATGSSICGAAAVLGAESVVKCPSHKTAVAVSTVVIFGTIAMFLYPIMYRYGLLDNLGDMGTAIYTGATLHEVAHVAAAGNAIFGTIAMFLYPIMYRYGLLDNLGDMGTAIYTGATLHEVAHVAAAGNAMDPNDSLGIAATATITKMIRVMMLAPVLIVFSILLSYAAKKKAQSSNMDPNDSLGIAATATITKMIRVMMLAPVLIVFSILLSYAAKKKAQSSNGLATQNHERGKITIPYFAIGFIAVIALNTMLQQFTGAPTVKDIPLNGTIEYIDTFLLTMAMTALGTGFIAVIALNTMLQQFTGAPTVKDIPLNGTIEYIDTFLLTMAMTALGTDTSLDKFKQAGAKPFLLASLLFVWLLVGGYFLSLYIPQLLA